MTTTPPNSCTFVATSNDVTATSISHRSCKNGSELREIIANSAAYEEKYGLIVKSSKLTDDDEQQQQFIHPARYGLASAILHAYNTHHNLILRPDDVWQAILTQFSFYVNANAEALRNEFVDFEGKKQLTIEMGGSLFTADYGSFAKRMVDEQISTNLKDAEVTEWLLPKFTTTTDTDRVVASVTIMSTLKAYFSYRCMLACGIPNVTLLGTAKDWGLLRQKLERLLNYDIQGKRPVMKEWHDLLAIVVDEFIQAVEGKPNLKFWDTIAHHIRGGSGPSYLSGWVTVFSCFNSDGDWQGDGGSYKWPRINTSKIPVGAVSVPVVLDDNGTEYEANMTAGQMCYEVVGKNTDTIKPRSDWCFAIDNTEEKTPKRKRNDEE